MKKLLETVTLFIALTVCSTGYAVADLIRGSFAGTIEVNGTVTEVETGAGFFGHFIYDTAAVPGTSGNNRGASFVIADDALIDLSFTLTGVVGTYSYMQEADTAPPVHVSYTDTGSYSLDFDDITYRQVNFIEEFDLNYLELLLEFEDTYITDVLRPVIMPDADRFVPGASSEGSVLYMWVWDEAGVNPGSAQINGNIMSLSLSANQPSQPIPEPATILHVVSGLACFVVIRRHKHFRYRRDITS